MLYVGLFLVLLLASALFWHLYFVPSQVKSNLADFKADGSLNSLGKAYHLNQWVKRALVGLPLCVVTAAPLYFTHWYAVALGFLTVAVLLLGIFCRFFTPKLNLARYAAGETHLSEWFASKQSQSWPDKNAWEQVRNSFLYSTDEKEQEGANIVMQRIVQVAWRWCVVVAVVLTALTVWLALR